MLSDCTGANNRVVATSKIVSQLRANRIVCCVNLDLNLPVRPVFREQQFVVSGIDDANECSIASYAFETVAFESTFIDMW
jgi:hypothetical protein